MTRTLGIIGSGNIGSTVARLALAAGFEVVVSNSRGPQSLADLVDELGGGARAATPAEAAAAGDPVVVSIPFGAYRDLPVDALAGRIVVDTMNYYPQRDGVVAELEQSGTASSVLVQSRLAGSRIVKAFNNIDARRLLVNARPAGAPDRSALPIASDDPAAGAEVAAMLDALGYDAVDLGALAESWRSEPGTPVYVQPYFPAPRPEGLDQAAMYRWYLETPGVAVPSDRVAELVRSAVRDAPH
jgi:8-hydroxy-5-deazaflavin:NADPH oxidoreductase